MMSRHALRISRRRLLAGFAALLAASAARISLSLPSFAAQQTLPPAAIELADGVFFPSSADGLQGYFVRDLAGGPHFWTLYDGAGGHSWYGPPLSGVWDDGTFWYQLFANALFRQAKSGGAAELAPIVDRIVSGPPVSSSFPNSTKLFFDGWPAYNAGGGPVHAAIQTFLSANPALQAGASRSGVRDVSGKRRNLFQNVGLQEQGGTVGLGVLGQLYQNYFAGKSERLPSSALATETFELGESDAGISDDLPGTVKGIDRGFGATLASEEGVGAGVQHMNELGLWWDREQFIWNAMQGGYDDSKLTSIATDRNFRVSKEIVGLLQFTPDYAGGGLDEPDKFNPPNGLELAWNHSLNSFAEFVEGVVTSRRPAAANLLPGGDGSSAQTASAGASVNPITRWIPWNEPDICAPWMPGYAWGGRPHIEGTLSDEARRERFYRLVQVAYDAMTAANPTAELIFPTLGLLDVLCDDTPDRTDFFDRWILWLRGQTNRAALVAGNFFFHHVSLALHKEPERVCEFVRRYRDLLDRLGELVGEQDPLAGQRKIILMETGLQDDPGLNAFFSDEDRAHYIIQAAANALVAGADELALHTLSAFPTDQPSGKGARVAVRYMSHVTRQHPNRRKRPDISGERVAWAYRDLVRIDLPGPGFVTTVVYNRDLSSRTLEATFTQAPGMAADLIDNSGPVFTSDHLGNEDRLELGTHEFTLGAPGTTFEAFNKTWAWVAGGTRVFRYPDTLELETPDVPATASL